MIMTVASTTHRRAPVVVLLFFLSSLLIASTSAFVVSPSTPCTSASTTTTPRRSRIRVPPTAKSTATRLFSDANDDEDGAKPPQKKRVKKKVVKRVVKKSAAPKEGANKRGRPSAKTETSTAKSSVAETPVSATPAATTAVNTPPPPPPQPIKTTMTSATIVANPSQEYFLGAVSKARSDLDTTMLGDLTGGRPGAVIETEEQLDRKQEIFQELSRGDRDYDPKIMKDYGELEEEAQAEYDITDDPDAIDATTLGTWTIRDLQSKFDYEWDPDPGSDDPDPNLLELQQNGLRYKEGVDVDDETGIEIGYDPIFGPSSPQDERTILGTMDSYMIDTRTKDDGMLTPEFPPGDLEIEYNQEIVDFRKALDIMETYTDEFLPDMDIPRHVAKWHGYPEPMAYPPKDESNNRFTAPEDKTDFSKMTPFQARRRAVELARAQNAEWLPNGQSQQWHTAQREPYEKIGTLVGTLRRGPCDETLVAQIQPALDVLKSSVELLSIEGEEQTVFRFHYHGLMKNKHGMAAWTETLIRDCGVLVTGVVFETGFRRRDMAYDGGDCWYPPST